MRATGELPRAWQAVLKVLLEEGQATANEIAAQSEGYAAASISGALTNMLPSGFVQHCGKRRWGLTKFGIEVALSHEAEAKNG